jgi:hypothetical protein
MRLVNHPPSIEERINFSCGPKHHECYSEQWGFVVLEHVPADNYREESNWDNAEDDVRMGNVEATYYVVPGFLGYDGDDVHLIGPAVRGYILGRAKS